MRFHAISKSRRSAILGSVALAAMTIPTLAAAQDAPATAPGAATPQTPVATPDTDGDIVVTARNREEKLQDVPLAITSFSSKDLSNANVRNLRDVAYLTPGLSITSGGSEFGVNPVIRGQTNLNGGAGDPNVAVFIDGVYISNNTAINVGLIDIERIEVVKGPVSALYGRNAFAGAINYVSKRPSISEPHASATGFVGNDGQYSFTGVLSYPVIKDVLGLRIATGYEHFDGSYHDKVTNQDAGGFEKRDLQASLYFTPTPELSVSAAYYYGNDTFGGSAVAYNVNNCGSRTNPPSVQDPSGLGFSQFCGRFDPDAHDVEIPVVSNLTGAAGNDRKVNLASLNVAYDFGFAKLSSLTGYTKVTQQRFTDFIGRRYGAPYLLTPGPGTVNLLEFFGSNTNTRDVSEELRLQSSADHPFRWQLGGFYFKGRNFSTTILSLDGSPIPAGQNVLAGFPRNSVTTNGQVSDTLAGQTLAHDKQLSGFVGAEYDVLPGLTASGEYRYTNQKKDQLVIRNTGCPSNGTANPVTCNGPAPTIYLYPNGTTPPEGTFKFSNYRGTLKYAVTPGSNVYASVANGTKAGGFNQRAVTAPDGSKPDERFDPETNVTYEIGIKNSFFDNRLQLNIAAYHIDTKGIQISGPSEVLTNPGLVTKNFGSVHTNGFEIELAAKVAKGARVHAGVGYSDPKFGKDAFDFGAAAVCASYNAATNVFTPIIASCAGSVVRLPAGSKYNPSTIARNALSLDGRSLPREADLQLTGGVDLDGAINADWKWTATYNARYESKQYGFNNNISWYGPRTIMNLRVGVENATYSIAAYVNNLTDDHTPEIVSVNARLSDFGGDLDGYLPVGRQYGLTLGAKF